MKPEPVLEGERWLRQAEYDLSDAQYSLAGDRYNLTCFLAQQCAEKAVKAYLFAQGAHEIRGHSVTELCREAAALDADFAGLGPKAGYLDRYYIPTRYPNGLPGGIPAEMFDRQDAEKALEAAAHAVALVRDKCRPSSALGGNK